MSDAFGSIHGTNRSAAPQGYVRTSESKLYDNMKRLRDQAMLAARDKRYKDFEGYRSRYNKLVDMNPGLIETMENAATDLMEFNPRKASNFAAALPSRFDAAIQRVAAEPDFQSDSKTQGYLETRGGVDSPYAIRISNYRQGRSSGIEEAKSHGLSVLASTFEGDYRVNNLLKQFESGMDNTIPNEIFTNKTEGIRLSRDENADLARGIVHMAGKRNVSASTLFRVARELAKVQGVNGSLERVRADGTTETSSTEQKAAEYRARIDNVMGQLGDLVMSNRRNKLDFFADFLENKDFADPQRLAESMNSLGVVQTIDKISKAYEVAMNDQNSRLAAPTQNNEELLDYVNSKIIINLVEQGMMDADDDRVVAARDMAQTMEVRLQAMEQAAETRGDQTLVETMRNSKGVMQVLTTKEQAEAIAPLLKDPKDAAKFTELYAQVPAKADSFKEMSYEENIIASFVDEEQKMHNAEDSFNAAVAFLAERSGKSIDDIILSLPTEYDEKSKKYVPSLLIGIRNGTPVADMNEGGFEPYFEKKHGGKTSKGYSRDLKAAKESAKEFVGKRKTAGIFRKSRFSHQFSSLPETWRKNWDQFLGSPAADEDEVVRHPMTGDIMPGYSTTWGNEIDEKNVELALTANTLAAGKDFLPLEDFTFGMTADEADDHARALVVTVGDPHATVRGSKYDDSLQQRYALVYANGGFETKNGKVIGKAKGGKYEEVIAMLHKKYDPDKNANPLVGTKNYDFVGSRTAVPEALATELERFGTTESRKMAATLRDSIVKVDESIQNKKATRAAAKRQSDQLKGMLKNEASFSSVPKAMFDLYKEKYMPAGFNSTDVELIAASLDSGYINSDERIAARQRKNLRREERRKQSSAERIRAMELQTELEKEKIKRRAAMEERLDKHQYTLREIEARGVQDRLTDQAKLENQ